jgi:hypothetical protein
MHVSKTRSRFPNLEIEGAKAKSGRHLTPNTASGIKAKQEALTPRRAVFDIDTTITVTAALDYGSVKLCDLPTGTMLILGALADGVVTGTGTGFDVANVDVGVGTAAASAATLATTMINVLSKLDGTAVTGVVQGANTAALEVEGTTPDLFLNVAVALSGDGTVRFVGRIEVLYIDLGDPAA